MAFTKITSDGIGDNAVTSDKIASGAITVADIPDGEITTAKLSSSLQSTISGKANSSSLSTVATSGSYSDLSNKPSLGSISALNSIATSNIDNNAITGDKIAVGATSGRFSYVRLPITGNISANTWYTLTNTGVFGNSGIGHISAYSNTVGYGGDHYDLIIDGGSVPLKSRTTNDAYTTGSYDFAKMAGHAPNAQRYYWRIRFQSGNPNSPLIEWQSTSAMSGLVDGVLVFYIHKLIDL